MGLEVCFRDLLMWVRGSNKVEDVLGKLVQHS